MKILVNSNSTIAVDSNLTRFVEAEVIRVLRRFEKRLTRVEVYLSDIDSMKTGKADKRCLIEVRPLGTRPRSVSARATKMAYAVDDALCKMRRSLTGFFGRRDRPAGIPSLLSATRHRNTSTNAARPRGKTVSANPAVEK